MIIMTDKNCDSDIENTKAYNKHNVDNLQHLFVFTMYEPAPENDFLTGGADKQSVCVWGGGGGGRGGGGGVITTS